MSANRTESIFVEILLALALAVFAGAALLVGPWVLGSFLLLRGLIVGITALYLASLVRGYPGGRLVLPVLAAVALGGLSFLVSSGLLLCAALFIVWAVRSLYRYSSFLLAAVDAALCAGALYAGCIAYTRSGSFAAAVWCFFLVQALYVLIPRKLAPVGRADPASAGGDDLEEQRFQAAARSAKEALAARL